MYHRCGYFDGANDVPYPGGYTAAATAAIDPNGHLYYVDETLLGYDFQLYATQWTGYSWTRDETPPAPAVSSIDDANFTSHVSNSSVAYDINGPAVAFEGDSDAPRIFYAQRRGGAWGGLGGSRQMPLGADGVQPRLLLDSSGNPWVTWLDLGHSLHLRAWNGSAWAAVGGNELIPAPPVTGSPARPNFDVAMDGQNNFYVVWSGPTDVFLLQWTGVAWVDLGGSASGGGVSQSPGVATLPAVAITSTGPAVSWSDNSSGYTEIYLLQWSGGAWVQIGGSTSGGGISNEQASASNFSLIVDHHGRLLPVWAVGNGGSNSCGSAPAHFRRFDGSTWDSIAGSADYTGCDGVFEDAGSGNGSNLQIFVDLNDIPILTMTAYGSISICAFY